MNTPTYHNIIAGPKQYSFGEPDWRGSWEKDSEPVVQVLQVIKGKVIPTPARYYASQMATLEEGQNLAIDYGQQWYVGVEDTAALREYARSLLVNA